MGTGDVCDQSVYQLYDREDKLKQGLSEDSVASICDALLFNAIVMRASDVHLQPSEHDLVVRYRIDGVLYDQTTLSADQMPLVLSRFKVLANLDIAERRLPQDGRLRVHVHASATDGGPRVVDFRLATFPTLYGEKMVIRILDRVQRLLSLDSLGLKPEMYEQLTALINRPHGLFLVTGPTGCGKTTMLYALISALNTSAKNIVTIEDPIEYELAGITQSQINTKAGFTFENGLRAMLRQDPDIIMVGEIRDRATAQIAIESALTGHLVLSTLHTNDAPSAVMRLLEMGVEPFLLSATLGGVLAQRLARRLCSECKTSVQASAEQRASLHDYLDADGTIFASRSCRACRNLGYKGRVGIFELLTMNDDLRAAVAQKIDAAHIRHMAVASGMKTLLHDGFDKMKAGITSLEEVLPLMVDVPAGEEK